MAIVQETGEKGNREENGLEKDTITKNEEEEEEGEKGQNVETALEVEMKTLDDGKLDLEKIREQVNDWKKKNPAASLNLFALHKDRFQIEATIGPDYYAFQVNFSEEWHPLVR